jgi:hypothetical protein
MDFSECGFTPSSLFQIFHAIDRNSRCFQERAGGKRLHVWGINPGRRR